MAKKSATLEGTTISEVQVAAQVAAGREVASQTSEAPSNTAVPANQNVFQDVAAKHAKNLFNTQASAMKDVIEAAKKGAAVEEHATDLYISAFKTALAGLMQVKLTAVNVYGSERKRILKVWNLKHSKIGNGEVTFGEFVIDQKFGYNKAKKLASDILGKKSRGKSVVKGTTAETDGKEEPKTFEQYMDDLAKAITGIAALGYGRNQDFKTGVTKFYDVMNNLKKPGEVTVQEQEQGEQQPLAKAA